MSSKQKASAITTDDARKVASEISQQMDSLITNIQHILYEDCAIANQHMQLCGSSVDELLQELNTDLTDMDTFIAKMTELIGNLGSIETLSTKIKDIKRTLDQLESVAQQIL
ncbi:hypothetical protein BLNAU_413 [Blattamonas nauphoetae]|uniref:BLOC-1-related complex subunit 6 C-terminal helix domain-containing protein n=1 Tax=Blattamonas nauphoetae TaxID=2049346 RepID=A0ABQ9YL81_9EUKA|nr:hypothetical protein BLNAU_413 [Blattamonas nauphoetae]